MSTKSFRALGASEHVCAALAQRGISEPFPIQELVLPDAMAGRDVLAKSPTGSGKTIAFAIPLAERISRDARTPAGLVLVPTRELAMQVAEETAALARARGLRVATAFGGVGIQRPGPAAARAHILVATPGRLEDLLAAAPPAPRRRLASSCSTRPTACSTWASARPSTASSPRSAGAPDALLLGHAGRRGQPHRDEVHERRRAGRAPHARGRDRPHRAPLHDDAPRREARPPGRRARAASASSRSSSCAPSAARAAWPTRLEHRGVRVAALHGDMTQSQRTRSLERFSRGHADTLVATDVAARGLDIDAITHVDQLRSAGRRSELHPPQRPHRPRGPLAARASRSCSTISARPSARWPSSPASTSRAASAPTRR